MKKFILVLSLMLFVLAGCSLGNSTEKQCESDANEAVKILEKFGVPAEQIATQTEEAIAWCISDVEAGGEGLAPYLKQLKQVTGEETVEAVDATTEVEVAEADYPVATIKIKDMGEMQFVLDPMTAPQSTYNFISLANSGFYDGLTMHRIIPGFVAQGGDPEGTGAGGPAYSIQGEFSSNGINNDIKHETGTLCMARSQSPDSAGSQFYINLAPQPSLDNKYACFGTMISGEEVLTELEAVGSEEGTPTTTVTIESIKVDTKGVEYPEPSKLP